MHCKCVLTLTHLSYFNGLYILKLCPGVKLISSKSRSLFHSAKMINGLRILFSIIYSFTNAIPFWVFKITHCDQVLTQYCVYPPCHWLLLLRVLKMILFVSSLTYYDCRSGMAPRLPLAGYLWRQIRCVSRTTKKNARLAIRYNFVFIGASWFIFVCLNNVVLRTIYRVFFNWYGEIRNHRRYRSYEPFHLFCEKCWHSNCLVKREFIKMNKIANILFNADRLSFT